MEPAIKHDARVLVFSWAYVFSKPKNGDLIVCQDPRSAKRKLLKRIVRVLSNQIWVEGDNTDFSDDSRIFGAISSKDIFGKVILDY